MITRCCPPIVIFEFCGKLVSNINAMERDNIELNNVINLYVFQIYLSIVSGSRNFKYTQRSEK